ncbi:MAG: MFS transporter [Nitrososphaerales archaeon]
MTASWLKRDGKIILAARGVRTFGYGFLSVILAIYLQELGFDPIVIGIVLTSILISGAFFTLLGSLYSDVIGRKKFLILYAILMATSGIIYATTTNEILLIIGALIGTLSPTGGEVGPFLSIEQAILPQTSPDNKRNSVFAYYSTIGQLSTSFGALFSGLPSILVAIFGFGLIYSYHVLFAFYALLAIITALLYLGLTTQAELNVRNVDDRAAVKKLLPQSKAIITKLSVLFGVDAFAGGFVLQSLVSYWFYTRYGVPLGTLALIFFASGVLSSVSFLIAGKLSDRIGAIKTMVFTHFPSNIFLILVPIAQTFGLSLAFYLARQSISLMDVPARQSYTVSVVKPSERTVAAGITNISRNTAQAISPSLSGYAMQFISLSLPFFVGGVLKIAYDVALYYNFRKIREGSFEKVTDS